METIGPCNSESRIEPSWGTQIILLDLSIYFWIYFLLFGPHLLLLRWTLKWIPQCIIQMPSLGWKHGFPSALGSVGCWRLKAESLWALPSLKVVTPPWEQLASKDWFVRHVKAWPTALIQDIWRAIPASELPTRSSEESEELEKVWLLQICSMKKRVEFIF